MAHNQKIAGANPAPASNLFRLIMNQYPKSIFDDLIELNEGEPEFNPMDEWKDMPEFVQEKQAPYALIKVRFDNEEDLAEFSKLIGQKLTNKTKSIWYPELQRGINGNKRYIDEDQVYTYPNES